MSDPHHHDASGGAAPPAGARSNGPAVAAIITGIIALLLSWIPGVNLLAIVLGIVAVITGVIGIGRANDPGTGGKGMAVTGIITGVLALLLSVLVYVGIASFFNDPDVQEQIEEFGSEVEEFASEIEEAATEG